MKSKTGFYYSEKFLDHDTGPAHPERPDRLRAIVSRLRGTGLWEEMEHPSFESAPEEAILAVHTSRHLEFVRNAHWRGAVVLDHGDTLVSELSFETALLAAGAVLAAVDAVATSELANAFCAVRPPGHHAESDTPMGFCLFNNVAIAARHAQQRHGCKCVAIVDWDVHHGNGTQEIFYHDPSVLYISTHQYPFYPGTGGRDETGEGPGTGFTLNIPMRAGVGEEEYVAAFKKEILPALDSFKPDLLILSAGFDAHRDDPLANINLTENSFGILTEMMMESAARSCEGKIVSVLEGGYNLQALARSVERHVRGLIVS